jgi:hypothetical protein
MIPDPVALEPPETLLMKWKSLQREREKSQKNKKVLLSGVTDRSIFRERELETSRKSSPTLFLTATRFSTKRHFGRKRSFSLRLGMVMHISSNRVPIVISRFESVMERGIIKHRLRVLRGIFGPKREEGNGGRLEKTA